MAEHRAHDVAAPVPGHRQILLGDERQRGTPLGLEGIAAAEPRLHLGELQRTDASSGRTARPPARTPPPRAGLQRARVPGGPRDRGAARSSRPASCRCRATSAATCLASGPAAASTRRPPASADAGGRRGRPSGLGEQRVPEAEPGPVPGTRSVSSTTASASARSPARALDLRRGEGAPRDSEQLDKLAGRPGQATHTRSDSRRAGVAEGSGRPPAMARAPSTASSGLPSAFARPERTLVLRERRRRCGSRPRGPDLERRGRSRRPRCRGLPRPRGPRRRRRGPADRGG